MWEKKRLLLHTATRSPYQPCSSELISSTDIAAAHMENDNMNIIKRVEPLNQLSILRRSGAAHAHLILEIALHCIRVTANKTPATKERLNTSSVRHVFTTRTQNGDSTRTR